MAGAADPYARLVELAARELELALAVAAGEEADELAEVQAEVVRVREALPGRPSRRARASLERALALQRETEAVLARTRALVAAELERLAAGRRGVAAYARTAAGAGPAAGGGASAHA